MPLSRRCFVASALCAFSIAQLPHAMAQEENAAAFQKIISDQIAAFGRDDGPGAFAHASPSIRQKFKTHENFMAMVQKGYSPVYRPRSFKFGPVTNEFLNRPTQRVIFIDSSGRVWTALYAFEQQPDGSWKIDGVAFTKTDEVVS